MKTIGLANFKGGVGKSTTAQNVAAALAKKNYKVCLFDFDPQCNLTMACGQLDNYEYGTIEAIFNGGEASPIPLSENLHLMRGDIVLAVADMQYGGLMKREHILERYLVNNKYSDKYDFIVIDCPPYLGLLTQNVLVVSDFLFVPIDCEFFSSYGLKHFKLFLNENGYEIDGIICTKYTKNLTLHNDFVESLKENYKDFVLKTIIPRNVSLSEAQAMGQSVFDYAPKSRGAKSYMKLTEEIISKVYHTVTQ